MKGVEGWTWVAGERIAAPISPQRGGREQGLGEPAACVPGLQAAELPPAAEVLMRCKDKQKGGGELLRKKAQLSEPERGFQCEPPAPGRSPRGRTGTLRSPGKNTLSAIALPRLISNTQQQSTSTKAFIFLTMNISMLEIYIVCLIYIKSYYIIYIEYIWNFMSFQSFFSPSDFCCLCLGALSLIPGLVPYFLPSHWSHLS